MFFPHRPDSDGTLQTICQQPVRELNFTGLTPRPYARRYAGSDGAQKEPLTDWTESGLQPEY